MMTLTHVVWWQNGATSVGLVAPLFSPDLVAKNDWAAIEANARKVTSNVAKVGPLIGKSSL